MFAIPHVAPASPPDPLPAVPEPQAGARADRITKEKKDQKGARDEELIG